MAGARKSWLLINRPDFTDTVQHICLESDGAKDVHINPHLRDLFLSDGGADLCRETLSTFHLMQQVPDTTIEAGRFSVSTTPDVPFKEMTSRCEALLMGKQHKMSVFMNAQHEQEIMLIDFSQDRNEENPTP
ncbi:hypothetical protein HPP92_010159 [Vanilla planifolia]|uniref:Uncharacterized protein n=1 Tax=Vanilla planifolia TaxID=51239 RepID=A0A835QYE5_VANPL|nr:hypothetical protein HPP92_010383 [Vanilla planifolia]KAG0482075.1 hypothetical protein HPP92_010159 [Vanilla planifolia]